MDTKKYVVLMAWAGSNYSAHVPDLPGCAAVGDTQEECLRNMQEAISLHIAGMIEDGDPVPEPSSIAGYVEAVA